MGSHITFFMLVMHILHKKPSILSMNTQSDSQILFTPTQWVKKDPSPLAPLAPSGHANYGGQGTGGRGGNGKRGVAPPPPITPRETNIQPFGTGASQGSLSMWIQSPRSPQDTPKIYPYSPQDPLKIPPRFPQDPLKIPSISPQDRPP